MVGNTDISTRLLETSGVPVIRPVPGDRATQWSMRHQRLDKRDSSHLPTLSKRAGHICRDCSRRFRSARRSRPRSRMAWRPTKTFYRSYRMCRRLQAQRRVSSAPGWSRSHLFGRHCQLRPLRTREVTALEVESQINSRNSRRVRAAVYSSRIAVTGFRRIARCAGK